jgi:hypothetical protein
MSQGSLKGNNSSQHRERSPRRRCAGRTNEVIADMVTVSSPLSSQLSWQRERLRQCCCFLHDCIGARPRYPAIKATSTWQPVTAIVALPSVIPAVKFPSSHVPFPASKNVPTEFVLLLKACIGTRA